MEQAMGPQSVRVFGVPPTTRLAQVMVAADYRLKRIALAHEPSPVREVVSYLDLEARTFRGQAVPQHRWWFVAGYDTLWQTPDGLGFEFEGSGVRVETARSAPGQQDGEGEDPEVPATRPALQFAESFTEHFTELAQKQPVFAELANVIGLAAAAALVGQKQDGVGAQVHWRPTVFLDAARCPLPEHPTPSQTPALASYRLVAGRHWLITISGGVEIDPSGAVAPSVRKEAERRDLTDGRATWINAPQDEARWWWD
jgi:hypothetical protein